MTGRAPTLAEAAHPFTGFAVTLAITLLAFLLPAPWGPTLLYAIVLLLIIAAGVGRAARAAALICLPLWGFLFLLHGVLGGGAQLSVGPIALSRHGLELALAQGARLGAVITATLALVRSFNPSRFLDAVGVRGWPFAPAYLLVATLQAAPRLRERVGRILEAQRTRGLNYHGSILIRMRAVLPLALPLILGALTEVDDRAMALDIRAVNSGRQRTPLSIPVDHPGDRIVRWSSLLLVVAAAAWRLAGSVR
jgi:energy-coupling factor transport system permease protein